MKCIHFYPASYLRLLLLLCILPLITNGCGWAPAFVRDVEQAKLEITDHLQEAKNRIADNAQAIYTTVTATDEEAKIIARINAEKQTEWAKEDISLTPSSSYDNLLNMGLGLATLLGFGGAAQGIRKFRQATQTITEVASVDGKKGAEIARSKGYKV